MFTPAQFAEQEVYESVRAALTARDWTQARLAHLLGVSPCHVCNIVQGRATPSRKLALKIHRVLHVSLESLLNPNIFACGGESEIVAKADRGAR